MIRKPKAAVGRALTDETDLTEDELDRIIAGAGPSRGKADENDGWSQIVDDHSKEIPVAPRPEGTPDRPRKTPDDKAR